jgi:ribose transport system substrate-binding protein
MRGSSPRLWRSHVALLVLCIGLSAAGCGKTNSTPTPAAPTAGTGPTGEAPAPTSSRGVIGFSALTLTNPFFKVIADEMTAEAAKHGYEVAVVSAENDVKTQADQVQEFIVKGVSAIVLNPCDSQSIGAAIAKANAAGIPVFTNDIKYDGAEGQVVCHIATDNYQGGRLAGEALVKLLGDKGGKVAVVHFPQVESCQLRVKGFTEVVNEHNALPGAPQIEIAATLDGGGARDAGFRAAKDAIESHPDLAALFAINDPSALGARSALEAAGKADQVPIIGFDGQLIGKQAIRDGKILCDPIQFPDRIGKSTIEQILKHFAGESVEPVVLIPSALYYKADALQDPELK